MHSIMHDWSDEICQKILGNLAKAMKPGYSKILIYDNVIPEVNADWEATSVDMLMMAAVASQERKVRHWHELVEGAGLKITGIFTPEKGTESLIECQPA
jgi:hypothetical protein